MVLNWRGIENKTEGVDIKMLKFILKLLIPEYFEYQEELEKQMKELESEVIDND